MGKRWVGKPGCWEEFFVYRLYFCLELQEFWLLAAAGGLRLLAAAAAFWKKKKKKKKKNR